MTGPASACRPGSIAWAVVALVAFSIPLSGACAVTDSKAATPAPASASSTAVQTSQGALAIDLRDAQAIAMSLRHFLETDPSVKAVPMLDSASGAWLRSGDTPFIGAQGMVRVGLWLLQARGDDLVLIYREPGAPRGKVSYRYVASVGRDAAGQWRVAAVDWEKLPAR
ncbi:MAG: hypothetical protein ACJ8G1_27735 [Vitreoscilla sp.]